MTREEFVGMLRQGAVGFKFKKKNGDLRSARGTLRMELIPADDHPKDGGSSGEGGRCIVPYV
jgi:hypothetical protein